MINLLRNTDEPERRPTSATDVRLCFHFCYLQSRILTKHIQKAAPHLETAVTYYCTSINLGEHYRPVGKYFNMDFPAAGISEPPGEFQSLCGKSPSKSSVYTCVMMFLLKFGAFVSQTKIIVLLSFKGHRQNTEIMLTEAKKAKATDGLIKNKKIGSKLKPVFSWVVLPRCWCSSGPYQLLMGDFSVLDEDSSLQSGAVLLSEE